MLLMPNCVYVIPNKKHITVKAKRLRLTEKNVPSVPNNAIDVFFHSLAQDQTSCAIAIILSGTGSDGTKGIESVKKAGGMVIVQDPATAKFDGMPNSAINSGYADFVLPPELMPEEIFNYIRHGALEKSFQPSPPRRKTGS
jgi:two-component system CheB/CheR fusion protein